jgi:cation transport ATPase
MQFVLHEGNMRSKSTIRSVRVILFLLNILFSLPFLFAAAFVVFNPQSGWNAISRILAYPVIILSIFLYFGVAGSWFHNRSAEIVLIIATAIFALLMCADTVLFLQTWPFHIEQFYRPSPAWWELSSGIRGIFWFFLNFRIFGRRTP